MRNKWIIKAAVFGIVFQIACPKLTYAYLDPGTGSMVIQAVIAALAAVGVSIGVFRVRVKAFLSRLVGRRSSKEHKSDDN